MEQNWEEELSALGTDILNAAKSELYLHMRFLDVALNSFAYVMSLGMDRFGTDGAAIYYDPGYLGGLYRENRIRVNRAYLHMVFHCVFRHLFRMGGREKRYWDLACDIAMEYVIDGLNDRSVRAPASYLRQDLYRRLGGRMKVPTAERVYRYLTEEVKEERMLARLEGEFTVDDHSLWPKPEDQNPSQQENQNRWQEISEQMQTDMETFNREASDQAESLLEHVKVENRTRYDYRKFLNQFAVWREEIQVDEDSFDYGFYSYGLRLYKNMPLIEPQEYKEVKRIQDFVIVIDTSMSCSGELVRSFLKETYGILTGTENFFRRVNIRILQCDDQIRADKQIRDGEELRRYMDNLELVGQGGTDFRPAFAYVEELREKGAFQSLKGLLYFTDGEGIYPGRKPDYDVAFVFMGETDEEKQVPPWAMKLVVDPDDRENQYEHQASEGRNQGLH